MSDIREQEIIVLLRDYMNILPSGPQEAYVPLGTGGSEDSWPLTAESQVRMDIHNPIGETYAYLDDALGKLPPDQYAAMLVFYLHDGAGHRDVDDARNKALANGNPDLVLLLEKHDDAIRNLAKMLDDADLWVRRPQKAPGPKPSQNMEDRHDELFAIFLRYMEDDKLPYRQSMRNARFKMTDTEGEPYYSERHAERIIKPKWKAYSERKVDKRED
jgi:hypothetical protein